MARIITRELIDLVAPAHRNSLCRDDQLLGCFYAVIETKEDGVVTKRRLGVAPKCTRCFLLSHLGCDTDNLPDNLTITFSAEFGVKQPGETAGAARHDPSEQP